MEEGTEFLGRELSAEVSTASLPEESGTETTIHGTVLDRRKNVLRVSAAVDPDWTTAHTEVYVRGLQFSSIEVPLNLPGLHRQLTLAPIDVHAAILRYPIGPLVIGVDAGFTLGGELKFDIVPTVASPLENSSIRVDVEADAQSSAYAEGAATLLIFKGGLRGEVILVDAAVAFHYMRRFDGSAETQNLDGQIRLLSGAIFAFFDVAKLFGMQWTHLWTQDLLRWDGACFEFREDQEGTRCVNPF